MSDTIQIALGVPAGVTAEYLCEVFANEFDTPGVRSAMEYARKGTITWTQCAALFTAALDAGLIEVQS